MKNKYEKELVIVTGTICNENCPYCLTKLHNNYIDILNKPINMSKLYELNEIDLSIYDYISIEGGEPGLISKENLDTIFNYLYGRNIKPEQIIISTNGLFLDNFLSFFDYFNYVYHVLSFDKFKQYNANSIDYIYVLNNDTLPDIIKLASTYPNIHFEIVMDWCTKEYTDEFVFKCKQLLENFKNIEYFIEHDLDKRVLFRSAKHFNMIHDVHWRLDRNIYDMHYLI